MLPITAGVNDFLVSLEMTFLKRTSMEYIKKHKDTNLHKYIGSSYLFKILISHKLCLGLILLVVPKRITNSTYHTSIV